MLFLNYFSYPLNNDQFIFMLFGVKRGILFIIKKIKDSNYKYFYNKIEEC